MLRLAVTVVAPFTALLDEASRWTIAISVPSCRYGLEKRTRERGHGVAWLLDRGMAVDRHPHRQWVSLT